MQTQENHLRPAATWVISSRKIISKMAADSGSLFFANFSNVLGWTSSPLKKRGVDIFQWTWTSKQHQSQHPNSNAQMSYFLNRGIVFRQNSSASDHDYYMWNVNNELIWTKITFKIWHHPHSKLWVKCCTKEDEFMECKH